MEYFHDRLREEIDRIGLKLVDAGRATGDPTGQGLRDVVTGRKRLTADLLARLIPLGVNERYVLTGERKGSPADGMPLTADEAALLAFWRELTDEERQALTVLLRRIGLLAPTA